MPKFSLRRVGWTIGPAAWFLLAAPFAAEKVTPAAEGTSDASITWNLADLYPSSEAWRAALDKARAQAEQLTRFKGTLGKGAPAMYRALAAISDLREQADRVAAYANLRSDEDLRAAPAQEARNQSQSLLTRIDEQTAWAAPEIIGLGRPKVEAYLAQDAELRRRFDFRLRNVLRRAPHTLTPEGENLLAASGIVLAQPDNVYKQLADAELPFKTIELSTGEKVLVNQSAYVKHRASNSRADRRAVFDAFWGSWKDYQGTMGANLIAQVVGDSFAAKARHFNGSLEAALFNVNMPPAVYRTLVAQAHEGLPTLYRYLRLRKRLLGIQDDLAYYDNYPNLFPLEGAPKFDVAASERITLAALAPMGEEYLGLLRRGFAGQWMNAMPHPGKASGAYMNGGAYEVHPYLLLNHVDDYESLSTLAHEWGHAVHTLLADASQPYEKSRYSTFIAESASIANEMLLNDYMVEHAPSRAAKLHYLGEGLESIRTTFFRQVMFAEFQLQMHEDQEQGRPLSGARLTEEYCTLLKRYYGEAEGVMKIDPLYCAEWEYIPHFYYGYYVYQYATSMAGAAQFTDAILKEGAPARDRFIQLLKAGGSDEPYLLYRRAGIDMASPAPYAALVARMNRIMDEIEGLMAN